MELQAKERLRKISRNFKQYRKQVLSEVHSEPIFDIV